MKLLNIKQIALASALVIGGTFSFTVNAQTNLITSLSIGTGTAGSGLSVISATSGPSRTQASFVTNYFSIAPSQAYTLSFNLSRSIVTTQPFSSQQIVIQPAPFAQVISIGTTSLSAGAYTYTLSASTLAPYVGVNTRFSMGFRNDGTDLFSVSDLLFVDGTAPHPLQLALQQRTPKPH